MKTGRVVHVRKNSFGFIEAEGFRDHVFFYKNDVVRDKIGRAQLQSGTPVSFELALSNDNRPIAVNVTNIDPALDEINPEKYLEIGTICDWFSWKRSGLIRRPNGEAIALAGDDIVTEGEDLIHQGMAARYCVAAAEPRWKAVDVWLYKD